MAFSSNSTPMPERAPPSAPASVKACRAAKPLLRFAIPLPPSTSVRDALAGKIETLIDWLDKIEPDPDLELCLGFYNGTAADCDLEADSADVTASLTKSERLWKLGAGTSRGWSMRPVTVVEVRAVEA